MRLTKSLSVQAKSGAALLPGALGTVVDVGDKVIVVLRCGLRGRLHGDRLHVVHLLRARVVSRAQLIIQLCKPFFVIAGNGATAIIYELVEGCRHDRA